MRDHFTRQERGLARRVTNRLLTQEQREFPSRSNPGRKPYLARVMLDGKLMCDCQGWTVKKKDGSPRQCTHTRDLVGGRPTYTEGDFMYLGRRQEAAS